MKIIPTILKDLFILEPKVFKDERGFFFESFNNMKLQDAGLEYNFFDFNLHETGVFGTPYLYSGLSYFRSKDLYVVNSQYFSEGVSGSLAFPIVAGYKVKITENFILAAETGVRFTFSDDLDGSSPKNNKFDSLKFGNTNSNDWYVFTGLTLSYTFGNKPWYCRE